MISATTSQNTRLWDTMIWVLRVTVVLQCLGTWDWFTRLEETPLLHWMLDPADVGGLNCSETTALAIQQAAGWLMLIAGFCTLLRPCAAVLGPVALVQFLLAVAMWRIDDGFSLESKWLAPQVTALFPLLTQMARYAAPVGLLLLDPWRVERPLTDRRVHFAIGLLRWAVAITFLAHGIEAWRLHPEFIDYWIATSERFFGTRMSQQTAQWLLRLIGMVDILTAVTCVCTRWRTVWWWMAFWGGLTAASRIIAFGVSIGWSATLMRAPHCGIPLAVALYFRLVRWNSHQSTAERTEAPFGNEGK